MVVCLTLFYQVQFTFPVNVACSPSAVAYCIVTPVPHCPVMVAVGGTSISSQRDISFPAESSFPVMVNEFPVLVCLELYQSRISTKLNFYGKPKKVLRLKVFELAPLELIN
jgi:hypothetical protein